MVHAYARRFSASGCGPEVFAGKRSPLILGEPPQWIAALLQASRPAWPGPRRAGRGAARPRRSSRRPATAGTLNGTPFEWIADADSRLGPVLEVLLNGAYYWVPFARIRRIVLETPVDVRDLVWMPAQFTWTNGGEALGLIPARYPGLRAKRRRGRCAWRARPSGSPWAADAYAGLGQRRAHHRAPTSSACSRCVSSTLAAAER